MNNNISSLINDFLIHKRDVENKRPKTCLAYKHDLKNTLLPFLSSQNIYNISEVTQQDIERFLVYILNGSKTRSPANRNRKLATIQSFLEYLQSLNIPYDSSIHKIKAVKNYTKTITYLTEDEKEHLLEAVDNKATPHYKNRDLAILTLFLNTGIRVSELINLQINDVQIHVKGESFIRIKRKGGNEAQLPIHSEALKALQIYLSKRSAVNDSYIFLSRNNKHLEANSVYSLVKHYLNEAGIEKRKMGPHVLRHTFGVSLRRRGIDIATIQQLLGHKKLETTSIYLNVESQDLVKAVQSLLRR